MLEALVVLCNTDRLDKTIFFCIFITNWKQKNLYKNIKLHLHPFALVLSDYSFSTSYI
jgi:hypothetical protein